MVNFLHIGNTVKVQYVDQCTNYTAKVLDIALDPTDPIYPIWIKLDTTNSDGLVDFWLDATLIDIDQTIKIKLITQ